MVMHWLHVYSVVYVDTVRDMSWDAVARRLGVSSD